MKLYGLVDCNNFFVSCERLFRPDLRDKPTLVGGMNDGVVVARSEEAKALGVPMGGPFFQIRDLIKEHNINVFSVNFELYRDISRRVMNTLREELDNVYQYSIDEAFFELELTDEESVRENLSSLKNKIEKNVGVPVSLGVGKTMTIAKYACEKEKRASGVCVLLDESWRELTPKIDLSNIWGVGGATARKLREHNINHVSDLLATDVGRVEKIFGIHGLRLRSELSEIAAHHPDPRQETQKSIMSTRSFSHPTNNLADLEDAVSYHCDRVTTELRESGSKAGTVRVILGTSRHSDWVLRGKSEEIILTMPSNDTREILREVISAVRRMYEEDVPYKKTGVVLTHIQDATEVQPDLFHKPTEAEGSKSLMRVLDNLKTKWGADIVTIGRIAKNGGKLISSKQCSPRYTTSWEDIKLVH